MGSASIVVVGAGQAGCQVVSSLREEGFDGRIVLIGAEKHLPYQRPPLSKGHLTGIAKRDSLWLRPEAWFAANDIEVHTGTRVVAIDRLEQAVELNDGSSVSYSTLVLALGAAHRELTVEGRHLTGVISLRTLDEADEVRTRMEFAERVIVIGGGFIGLEVASTAVGLGRPTTVIEVADRLMGRVLSDETSAFLLRAHRTRGMQFVLGTGIDRIVGVGDGVAAVDTSDGQRHQADLVLVGVGAVPQVGLAEAAGLEIDNGVVVDEFLCTSDPSIYAVGDCASAPNPYAGGARVRLESVQNAVAQARAVAASIAGRDEPFSSVPWFWSDQADLKLQIAGLSSGHDRVIVKGDPAAEKFSAFCFANSRLLAIESINRPADHMAARRLLASAAPVMAQTVGEDSFDLKAAAAAVGA
jgi:3-phenylpropionate/trans-cinnamate dioxygenase ferredoxin reductase subunit